MTHTPAVDSLEQTLRMALQHIRICAPDPTVDAALEAALTRPPGGSERLREALESIEQYGSDTLSGRTDGPDDRQWQRAAVVEMTRRATAALASPQGAEQRQEGESYDPAEDDIMFGWRLAQSKVAKHDAEHIARDVARKRATPHPEQAANQGDAVPVDALENLALCELGAAEISPEDADAISQHIVALRKRAESAETKLAALSSPTGVQAAQVSGEYQARVGLWMARCFPRTLYGDMTQRCDRFLEESLELLQAMGYDRGRVATLVDYVWGRPVGHAPQEVGGTVVTLAALCWVAGIDMRAEADRELARIEQPEVMAKIQAKQQAKNALHFDSPLPGSAAHGGEVSNGSL